MPVPSVITDLSVIAASNSPAGSDSIGTSLDDYLRSVQAIVKREQSQGAAIASSATTAIGGNTDGNYLHITGTTTITSFGTVAAGISRTVVFDGVLTLTNSASLVLPGGANITTAAGDVAEFVSEGGGIWRGVAYVKAAGLALIATSNLSELSNAATARSNLGLGTVATLTAGQAANNVPQMDASANFLITSGGGLGYGIGSGGTATQATSKGTAVTLNKPSGKITLNNASLASNTAVTFLVNNSLIGFNDTVVVTCDGISMTTRGAYQVTCVDVGSGNCVIRLVNITAGSLSEAIAINFSIIKGATS